VKVAIFLHSRDRRRVVHPAIRASAPRQSSSD